MGKRAPRKGEGRPTTYTQQTALQLCLYLAEGESLRTACAREEMPAVSTVFLWLRDHKEFLEQYARAKEEAVEAMAEEILDISDNGENDWMEKHFGRDSESTWVVNGEAVQRSKLRVDTRKWIMSKLKAKKYGDKVDVTSDGKAIEGNAIVFKDFNGTKPDSK